MGSSLTTRILLPLIGIALLASVVVSWTSWSLGQRWAEQDIHRRYLAIEAVVANANYPLTDPVIRSLAELTGTDWITVDPNGRILRSTIERPPEGVIESVPHADIQTGSENQGEPLTRVSVGEANYLAIRFRRQLGPGNFDNAASVVVLFDESLVASAAYRAALPPLITGVSTIVLLTVIMLIVSSRIISRLRKLQGRVEQVAAGDFTTAPVEQGNDEITHLATTLNRMAQQLKELWAQVNRQQGEKLLYQISGGMAHQLRNTLTGARMAIELHREACDSQGDETAVAIRQLEIAEQYVHRLLMLGRQGAKGEEGQPEMVATCLDDVRLTHETIADHLHVQLSWQQEEACSLAQVRSGALFSAAVSNLVLNAMQAGDSVGVSARIEGRECVVEVKDNGPGIDPQMESKLFEPFATTRPEGMGLGLPLVKRAAVALSGSADWQREANQTLFRFRCAIERK